MSKNPKLKEIISKLEKDPKSLTNVRNVFAKPRGLHEANHTALLKILIVYEGEFTYLNKEKLSEATAGEMLLCHARPQSLDTATASKVLEISFNTTDLIINQLSDNKVTALASIPYKEDFSPSPLNQFEVELQSSSNNQYRIYLIRALLLKIIDLSGAEKKSPTLRRHQLYSKLNELSNYISNNPGRPLTRDQLCQQFGIKECYLARLFSANLKMTFKQFLVLMRLEHARGQLSSEKSISEIGVESGFSSFNHFIYAFRTTYGIPPLQLRKQIMDKKKLSEEEFKQRHTTNKFVFLQQVAPKNIDSCELVSRDGGSGASLFFINETEATCSVHWINTEGQETFLSSIQAQKRVYFRSNLEHLFVVRDCKNNQLNYFRVTSDRSIALIV